MSQSAGARTGSSASSALHHVLEQGGSVVTPNRRLARYLKQGYDHAQLSQGRKAWPSADVLPLSVWLTRMHQRLAIWDADRVLPASLQELALWRHIIASSESSVETSDVGAIARLARDTWAMQCAWRVHPGQAPAAMSRDCAAYAMWAREFQSRCRERHWIPAAAIVEDIIHRVRENGYTDPEVIALYGFDFIAPQVRAMLDTISAAGARVHEQPPGRVQARCVRSAFASREDELKGVAARVRAILQADADAKVGVVVPDLDADRARVMRIFDDVLQPGAVLASENAAARPYNISLGLPLALTPVARAAMAILDLAHGDLSSERAGLLLLSPFVGCALEHSDRARMDAALRRQGGVLVSARRLQRVAQAHSKGDGAKPGLSELLRAWLPVISDIRHRRQSPSHWSDTFVVLLDGLGWPGDRALNSEEFQAVRALREAVRSLSCLDAELGTVNMFDALECLRQILYEEIFQPESEEGSVQILGVLESVGMEFDHLFVTTMHDAIWPGTAHPNAFLPASAQRAARAPHCDAEWELAFAERTMRMWSAQARTLTYTHAHGDGDTAFRPSRLISTFEIDSTRAPESTPYARRIHLGARLETIQDDMAAALPPGHRGRGGADVLTDQAACPFRAFARSRLQAKPLEPSRAGLDARERGALLHRVLASFYAAVTSWEQLHETPELERHCMRAVDDTLASFARERPDVLVPAFRALERARLIRLVRAIAELDKERAPFQVLACEESREIDIGGLRLRARVDRIDGVGDEGAGGRIILDYKTNDPKVAHWAGDRPDHPQLPLYAVTDVGPVRGVAFLRVKADSLRYIGLSEEAGWLPGVTAEFDEDADWASTLSGWRTTLERLARDFLAGDARVDPKKYPDACRYCGLEPLCRVKERFALRAVEVDDDE